MMGLQRPYRVERISTEGQLRALMEPWTALLAGLPRISIFLTWEWASTWWRHFGSGKELWVLAVRDASGRLAGIVPWMLTVGRLGPLRVRRVTFLGSGRVCPDHLDIIARPGEREAVCAAFVGHLSAHQHQWDVLDLQGLAQDSPLKRCLAAAKGRRLARKPQVCPFAVLPSDWGTFQTNNLGAKKRRFLRYSRRRLEGDHPGQVTFQRVSEPGELGTVMDALGTLNRKRHHARGRVSCFDEDGFVAFHRDMAALALERGWLRLYQLKVADQIVAVQHCFHYHGVFYDYQKGFDPDWGKYSPGQVLQAHAVREAIAEGASEFDMLREGEAYKFTWTDQARVDHHLLLSGSQRGHVGLLGMVLSDGAKRVANEILPLSVKLRIVRFLSNWQRPNADALPRENPLKMA